MKIVIIYLFIILGVSCKDIKSQNVDILSKEDVIYYLGHRNIKYFPDSLWFETINDAFKYIKTGDSLVFSETISFTLDNKGHVLNYITVYWEDLILNNTELFLSNVALRSKEDRTWMVHIAWLNSETITHYHENKLLKKLKKLESLTKSSTSELAGEFIERYEYIQNKKKRW